MPANIEAIRAELDKLREDSLALFDRIEQYFAGNPSADPLKLPAQEDMPAAILRRRTNAAAGKIEMAVQQSNSQLAKQEYNEFPSKVRQWKAALELTAYKGSHPPPPVDADWGFPGDKPSISVAEARAAALGGFQAAKELLALVSGTSSHTPKVDMSTPKASTVSSWDQIEIKVLGDHDVQVIAGGKSEALNYAEFGFEDRRKGTPNRAWQTLLLMAEQGGRIPPAYRDYSWPKVEKRMQEIRKVLRARFGIHDDPLTYHKKTGYRARFKIGCAPSAKS